jgi:Lar family restriction alleviation protein
MDLRDENPIRPCPFCGGEAGLSHREVGTVWLVQTVACLSDACGASMTEWANEGTDALVTRWNQRPSP